MQNIFYNRMTAVLGLTSGLYVKSHLVPLILALVCVVVSCDDDEQQDDTRAVEDDKNNAEDDGSETDPDAGKKPAEDSEDALDEDAITLSWKVMQNSESSLWDRWQQPRPQGVEVCLIESIDIPCVYTDDKGFFVLEGVPQNRELLLTFTKKDYVSSLVMARTGTSDFESALFTAPIMVKTKASEELLDQAGVVQQEDKGAILFVATNDWVLDGPPGRVSISIDPSPDDGPFYWDDSVQNVADAREISTDAPLVSFYNADEGEYRITWEVQEPEDMHCAILGFDEIYGSAGGYMFGLPAAEANTVRINVRAGFVSTGTIVCLLDTDADADAGL